MGWRVTAQNLNLNRDYVKADAPEMQSMLALVNAWDPLAYIDLHVTDGAKFQVDVSIQVEPVHGGDAELRRVGSAMQQGVIGDLRKQGSDPQPFYVSFDKDDEPTSGFVDSMAPPRYSTGYFPMRNRLALLVETHSWKDYPTRVRITRKRHRLAAGAGRGARQGLDEDGAGSRRARRRHGRAGLPGQLSHHFQQQADPVCGL